MARKFKRKKIQLKKYVFKFKTGVIIRRKGYDFENDPDLKVNYEVLFEVEEILEKL